MNNEKTRAEFTNWLDTLAYRTKLNYIRSEQKHKIDFSIDEFSEDRLESEEFHVAFEFSVEGEFDFQAEWLEKAFSKLSDTCKETAFLGKCSTIRYNCKSAELQAVVIRKTERLVHNDSLVKHNIGVFKSFS